MDNHKGLACRMTVPRAPVTASGNPTSAVVVVDPPRRWQGEDVSDAAILSTTTPRLAPAEVEALRLEAHHEYRHRVDRLQLDELCREERGSREELASHAASTRAVLTDKQAAAAAALVAGCGEGAALAQLRSRLRGRAVAEAAALAEREAAMRSDGREAWLAEVALTAARGREADALAAQRRREADQFRAAVTFIVCLERGDRAALAADAAALHGALAPACEMEKAAAAAAAHERWLSSPEQQSAREAEAKGAARAHRLAAAASRRFALEQQRFITSCHHATSGGSLFDGPAPKKVCGRCRVRYDDGLQYYVRMDDTATAGGGGTSRRATNADSAVGNPRRGTVTIATTTRGAAAVVVAVSQTHPTPSSSRPSATAAAAAPSPPSAVAGVRGGRKANAARASSSSAAARSHEYSSPIPTTRSSVGPKGTKRAQPPSHPLSADQPHVNTL